MKLLVALYLVVFGKKVGTDIYKNTYYEVNYKRKKLIKRFVLYKGLNEASKVPPEWEAWLRLSTKDPINNYTVSYKKQAFLPNLTGTVYAYTYTRDLNTKKVKSNSFWNDNK